MEAPLLINVSATRWECDGSVTTDPESCALTEPAVDWDGLKPLLAAVAAAGSTSAFKVVDQL
ncbi:hypothetical protein JOF56_008737 [Kibdelosporangium banguiense]|uniref:Uncharacterized protein n=1 Tax=Kibdelosporangium banguiense TaxID=1365924 RepID=A0ABS4TVE2_9PSEU|nr:hypothetical protein [Kibdelosporangium banguiense]MBP2328352.1 hypothetical protein [Kibdelosporangium banguiense]